MMPVPGRKRPILSSVELAQKAKSSANRPLKNADGRNGFRFGGGGCGGPSRHPGLASPLTQAASSFGNRARLLAAMVRVNRARTRSRPRRTVCAIPPTVLAQPKGSSIFLRRFLERA